MPPDCQTKRILGIELTKAVAKVHSLKPHDSPHKNDPALNLDNLLSAVALSSAELLQAEQAFTAHIREHGCGLKTKE